MDEARSHTEGSISIWRNRGRFDNAIHGLQALVDICADQDDFDSAIEYAVEALALCIRSDDDRRRLFVDFIMRNEDEGHPPVAACNSYHAALLSVSDYRSRSAHGLFPVAFRQRDAVDGEALRRSWSAGVGLAALHDVVTTDLSYDPLAQIAYSDMETLLEDVSEHTSDLWPPVVDCLSLMTGITAEGAETDDIDDSLRRREESALGRLTTLALSCHPHTF